MKSILSILLMFMSLPIDINAKEWKCLEYGKKECARLQVLMGVCAELTYTLRGDTYPTSNAISFYQEVVNKKMGYKPTSEDRSLPNQNKELEILAENFVLFLQKSCPEAFNTSLNKSFNEYKSKKEESNQPLTKTIKEFRRDFAFEKYLFFEGTISMGEKLGW